MNAYLPHDPTFCWLLAAVLTVIVAAGFAITRLLSLPWARLAAWTMVLAGVVGIERLSAAEPAGVRMLAIISVLLWAMKAVVAVEAQGDGYPRLTPVRWLGFTAMWF